MERKRKLVEAQGPWTRAVARNLEEGQEPARIRELQKVAALMARQRRVVRNDDSEVVEIRTRLWLEQVEWKLA